MAGLNNDIEYIILKYFSKEATQDDMAELVAWLNADDKHLEIFAQLKNIWEVSNPSFGHEQIDAEAAYINVSSDLYKKNKKSKSLFYYWQKVAAIIVVPLLFISAYFYLNNYILDREEIIYQEIFTPYGSRSMINLPDNSTVWLNAGSTLKYPVRFEKGERKVFLDGEAYFEVESDKKNPFIVTTGKIDVIATGTEFNVEAYNTDTMTSVTLVGGIVDFTLADNSNITLQPDEKITYNHLTLSHNINKTDTYKWCSWKDGILAFRNDPLEYVFKRLGQTYNINFVIKDKELGKYMYHATFEDESLDEIMDLLKVSTPIYYKKVGTRKDQNNYYYKQTIEVYRRR